MGACLSKLAAAAWAAGSAAYGAYVARWPDARLRGHRARRVLDWWYGVTAARLWQRGGGASPSAPAASRWRAVAEAWRGPPDWANPGVRGRNRLPAHAPLRAFPSAAGARTFWAAGGGAAAERHVGAARLCLSGAEWRFSLAPTPTATPHGFEADEFDDDAWAHATVPSNWQCAGFDRPIYSNITYPFACDPPRAERRGTWCAAHNANTAARVSRRTTLGSLLMCSRCLPLCVCRAGARRGAAAARTA
jgi:hypothetical protein